MKTSRHRTNHNPAAFIENNYYVLLILVLLITLFNLFYNLNAVPINNWDEARHGVNAYEMLKENNFIVNTYGFKPDYYNLKPPLSYWFVILGYKLFGFKAFGLRFFSALAAFITIVLCILFVKMKHGNLASLITGCVLCTSSQYILVHAARTGDADSLFVLFFTISMAAMLLIGKNIKWFYICGLGFSMAFMCKSWHALAIAAIGGLYLLLSRNIKRLSIKNWIVFLLCCFLPIFLWFLLRFRYDGLFFFKEMVEYDLLSRSSSSLEGHKGNMLFYFSCIKYYYSYWFILFILGFILLLKPILKSNDKNYFIGLLLWIAVPVILFTIAKTKLSWYILPIYPAISIFIGCSLANIIKENNSLFKYIIIFLIILSSVKYEKYIFKEISHYNSDTTEITLKSLRNIRYLNGYKIYTECGTYGGTSNWDQNHFLEAELYGNHVPINGGESKFLSDSDNNNILLLPKDENSKQFIKNNKLKIVFENTINYIIKKQAN